MIVSCGTKNISFVKQYKIKDLFVYKTTLGHKS